MLRRPPVLLLPQALPQAWGETGAFLGSLLWKTIRIGNVCPEPAMGVGAAAGWTMEAGTYNTQMQGVSSVVLVMS